MTSVAKVILPRITIEVIVFPRHFIHHLRAQMFPIQHDESQTITYT